MENKILCKNCSSPNVNHYCSDCGQRVFSNRFIIKGFLVALLAVFNIEKGFLYTVKMLFVQPGKVTNDYLNGKTKCYFNPLKYLLIIGGVYAFLILYLKIFDAGLETLGADSMKSESEEVTQLQNKLFVIFKQFINFIPLLLIPFISVASKWYYRSKNLFYAEYLIINSFLFVQTFLIIILLTPLVILFPAVLSVFPFIVVFVIFAYLIYSYKSTFQKSLIHSIGGALFSVLIGYLLFCIFLIVTFFILGLILVVNKIVV